MRLKPGKIKITMEPADTDNELDDALTLEEREGYPNE